ncbi:hypothetical protein [Thiolapillus sp.]|uniref:hypothetical protein n=1 Tax=Thiolapillus sp. TaxID=2017437 RepID=UPI003AF41FED
MAMLDQELGTQLAHRKGFRADFHDGLEAFGFGQQGCDELPAGNLGYIADQRRFRCLHVNSPGKTRLKSAGLVYLPVK